MESGEMLKNSPSYLHFSQTVAQAIKNRQPIVALESRLTSNPRILRDSRGSSDRVAN